MKTSVIIASCNDAFLNRTIKSIRETGGENLEIIVVDDRSDVPVVLDDKSAILIRNNVRVGPGSSRHIGVEAASGDYVLLIDAHHTFVPGWLQRVEAAIKEVNNPMVTFSGTCCGLDDRDMVMELTQRDCIFSELEVGRRVIVDHIHGRKSGADSFAVQENGHFVSRAVVPSKTVSVPAVARYHAAVANILGPNPNNPKEHQIMEGCWANPPKERLEIRSCHMGACSVYNREYFLRIGGLKWNRNWSSEEINISLKIFMTGGEVRLIEDFLVGHKFNTCGVPYKLLTYFVHVNKLKTIYTLFNDHEIKIMERHFSGLPDIRLAAMEIEKEKHLIAADRAAFQAIQTMDVEGFCKKFEMKYPF